MYDFHKSRQENHENIFKHALFKRGHKYFINFLAIFIVFSLRNRDLLKNIKRKATFESITQSSISLLPKTHMPPMITANGHEFDVERYNKDYNVFMQEVLLKNYCIYQENLLIFQTNSSSVSRTSKTICSR